MTRQVQSQTKARLWLRNHRTVIMVALCMAIMICPAFAATIDEATKTQIGKMFGTLDTVFAFVKGICVVAAAATIASLGYAFFFAGGSDADKRISEAKSRAVHVISACAVLFLLPTIMTTAKGAITTSMWNPDDTSTNHLITPAEGSTFFTKDDASQGGDETAESDGSGSASGGSESGTNGSESAAKTEEEKAKEEEKKKKEEEKANEKQAKIKEMKQDPLFKSTYHVYWDEKRIPDGGEYENLVSFVSGYYPVTLDDFKNHS